METSRRTPALAGDGTLLGPWPCARPPKTGRYGIDAPSPFPLVPPPIEKAPDWPPDAACGRPFAADARRPPTLFLLPLIPAPLRGLDGYRRCYGGAWLLGERVLCGDWIVF